MARILTSFLVLHWTVAFATLAALCLVDLDPRFAAALHDIGLGVLTDVLGAERNMFATGALATACLFVSVLFLWAFLVQVFADNANSGEGDDVLRLAFAAAGALHSICLIGALLLSAFALIPFVALHLIAILASYLAIHVERVAGVLAAVKQGSEQLSPPVRAVRDYTSTIAPAAFSRGRVLTSIEGGL